ncbi:MAG: PD-(D/E)XK nuclease family protein [Candidatus Terrybacteria bacterium]|nr:PD-(D/E)XK nuclease family protein [Candidatus Terrybacteria bacterium]
MRISYSSLDTFKTCPLKYKLQDIDRIRAPKNIEQIFGASIHSTLKYMFERKPLYPTLNQIIDFFRNLWDQQKTLIKNEDVYFKEGISLLERFYKRNQPWNFNVVDLESRFEVDLDNPKTGEKHVLAGIIDRIDKNDDAYEIIDYKTARKMPGQDNIDKDLQMSIYHLGLLRRWPHLDPGKIKLSFYYLKHGEKISTSRNKNQLEENKKFIFKTIDEIKERIKNNYDFPPLPSGLCDWCGYKQMCPMWKHLYQSQISNFKSQKDIEPVIKEYFELKDQNDKNNDRLDELKTLIYGFMDEQKVERVFGAEGYLTRKMQEKISYDIKKIKEFLKEKIDNFIIKKQFTILTALRKKIEK